MLKKRDVPYYRKREEEELERAVHADSDPARKAHLTLADMYHRELDRYGRIKTDRASRLPDLDAGLASSEGNEPEAT